MATIEFKLARLPMLTVRADYECDAEQEGARTADEVIWECTGWSVHCGSEDVSVFFCLDDGCTPVEALRDLIAERIVEDIDLQMQLSEPAGDEA